MLPYDRKIMSFLAVAFRKIVYVLIGENPTCVFPLLRRCRNSPLWGAFER